MLPVPPPSPEDRPKTPLASAPVPQASNAPKPYFYQCPRCKSDALSKRGKPSILDQKSKWKCDKCGAKLGTNRTKTVLLASLVPILIATLAGWVVLFVNIVSLLTRGDIVPDPCGLAVMVIGGGMGPIALLIIGIDFFSPRPIRVERPLPLIPNRPDKT